MFNILHKITRRGRSAFAAMALSTLAGIALLGAGGEANAGYTCVDNVTQVGNTVTMSVAATSGGYAIECLALKIIETSSANISISGSVVSTQVGPTTAGLFAALRARPVGLDDEFSVFCTQSGQGGLCTASNSGDINGVESAICRLQGVGGLPDPALPGVPVIITATCTLSY